MRNHWKRVLVLLSLILCLTALPVLAADEGSSATSTEQVSSGPNFATTALLFIGVGAILAVGGIMIMRENAKDGHEVD